MPTDRALVQKESMVYAEVLLEAAKASDVVFELGGQLEQVLKTVRGSIDLRTTLSDHTIDPSIRYAIVQEVFADYDPALLSALRVMVERDDVALLSKVNEAYNNLAEEALGAVIIDVTTVVELDDALRDKIETKYAAAFNKDVLLREHVDPSIIGGIILSTHGRRIDASVISQLETARVVLSTVTSGGER
ncbi:MAG: ATP synthase F1 subunit delta [Coriobacteriaceae bacterium]|nr:ATP synthase F1 subunit delta [Coriobacteriaceae bacterium]